MSVERLTALIVVSNLDLWSTPTINPFGTCCEARRAVTEAAALVVRRCPWQRHQREELNGLGVGLDAPTKPGRCEGEYVCVDCCTASSVFRQA